MMVFVERVGISRRHSIAAASTSGEIALGHPLSARHLGVRPSSPRFL